MTEKENVMKIDGEALSALTESTEPIADPVPTEEAPAPELSKEEQEKILKEIIKGTKQKTLQHYQQESTSKKNAEKKRKAKNKAARQARKINYKNRR